jgi:phosphodiesterase/alkaline phosphatase D-like protein
MSKTFIVFLTVVVLLVLAGIGYAVWSYNSPQVSLNTQNQATTTTTNTIPVSASQPSSPVVQTNSNTAPYISTVVVSGTVNPSGAPTTYWYEYGETSALGTQTSIYTLGSEYATFYAPAYITGLKSNTNYYFRLRAKNSIGTESGLTYSFKTSTTPAPTGAAPEASTASASNVARPSANLNGQINPENSVTTFWFEYGSTSNLGTVTSFQTSDVSNSSSAVSASVSNLQPFTKYYFRLDAQNQFGTVNGQILNFTTNGPVTATVPTVKTNSVTAITSTGAKLNASVNPSGYTTTYSFEYSKSSLLLNGGLIFNVPQQSLSNGTSAINVSASITNLTNNTKYYVRVIAINQYGTVRGDMVSFTTKR